jgi:hypothetical protein
MAGDVIRMAGALRAGGLTCAKAVLLPHKTSVAVMKARLRIGASCVLKQHHY